MKKSVKKNMIMNIILTASNFIFPLITYTYVTRVLGTEGIGKVAFVNSIIQYFHYLATLGIPAYGLRECAKVRDNKEALSHIVQELLLISFVSTFIAYAGLACTVLIVPQLLEYKNLFVVMSVSIFLNTIGLEWIYKALEEYSYITVRSINFKVISVILTFILIRSSEDYVQYGFLTIFTSSASYICNFINIRKYISFKKKGQYNLKKHIKPIFTLFVATAVITIYANFDISMIGFISSENEVGLYNAALRIKSIILSVSTAVTSVLIPRMAYNFQQKKIQQLQKLIVNSLRVSLILAMPIAVFVFIFSQNILQFVCGDKFLNASNTLRVLMLCIIPLMFTNLFGNQLLIPMGLEKRYSQSVFVGMLINLVLNFIMIPILGAYGAAIATLITESWNVFWMSDGVKEYRYMLRKKIKWLRYLLSLAISSVLSWSINIYIQRSFGVFFQLVFSASIFFGTYYGILIILKEPLLLQQISNLMRIIKNRRKNREQF